MDTSELLNELKRRQVPIAKNRKKGIAHLRSCVFGIAHKRLFGPSFGAAAANKHRPDLWALIKSIPVPISYDSVQVNQNATAGPHKDKNNVGLSYIMSIGDYVGGDLVIQAEDGTETSHALLGTPGLIFDGSCVHWNTPHEGTKYSLIFYTIEPTANVKAKFGYPDAWRSDPRYTQVMEGRAERALG